MATSKYTDKLIKTAPQIAATSAVLSQLVDGTLAMDKFRNLVIQDIIINEHWKKFIAVLLAKLPSKIEMLGNQDSTVFLANHLANRTKHNIHDRMRHELKIKKDEIQPSIVTKAICDFLMTTIYNKTYKDALVVLFASTKCIPQTVAIKSGNPLYNDWLQAHIKAVDTVGNWAIMALNEIRQEDQVNAKHAQLFDYATKYENTFWASIDHPELYAWPS